MGWKLWAGSRNALLALAATVVGVCAYLLAQRYLHGQEAVVRERLTGQYATREILVAARDLAAGSVLVPATLARRAVPVRFLASDVLPAEQVSESIGRRLARPLTAGEAVTVSALEAVGDAVLSSLVEPGLRALTIPVDDSSAAGGMLSPGDSVDLLLVTRGDESTPGAPAVRPLLQAVKVVATGQQLVRRRPGATREQAADDGRESMNSYATVTLHVSAEDAERILLAQRLGEVAVLLRPEGDFEPTPLRSMDAAALLDVRTRQRSPRSAGRVEFIVGGMGVGVHARRASP